MVDPAPSLLRAVADLFPPQEEPWFSLDRLKPDRHGNIRVTLYCKLAEMEALRDALHRALEQEPPS